ncbi:hypothetical protein IG631_04752 [Alternaria alternata]|nr:hypothetical protein IG631_04752 [Alternaria alternata]
MSSIPVGVYGRRIPAGGIPILAAVDQSVTVSILDASCGLLAHAKVLRRNFQRKFCRIRKSIKAF